VSNAVEIESLEVRFGSLSAVSDVSLTVEFGEIAVVLGPNGAGKTTTVETLLGFRRPTSGTVRVTGLDPTRDRAAVVATTGALLQRGGVWFPMSPRQALELTSMYYSHARDVAELISLVGLERCATTPWRRLSGGEQQRTLLALALVGRPTVLVLDEPTSAIDPEGHQLIRQLLADERDRGCALVVTTHELADAEQLATHLTIIANGAVIAAGTPDELAGPPILVFESSVEISVAELSTRLGVVVVADGTRTYRCDGANAPERVATITNYLSEHDGQLVTLRSRATLEERYLELVAGETPEPRP
jgi:ABC-2 type transport system ATP-binding protein